MVWATHGSGPEKRTGRDAEATVPRASEEARVRRWRPPCRVAREEQVGGGGGAGERGRAQEEPGGEESRHAGAFRMPGTGRVPCVAAKSRWARTCSGVRGRRARIAGSSACGFSRCSAAEEVGCGGPGLFAGGLPAEGEQERVLRGVVGCVLRPAFPGGYGEAPGDRVEVVPFGGGPVVAGPGKGAAPAGGVGGGVFGEIAGGEFMLQEGVVERGVVGEDDEGFAGRGEERGQGAPGFAEAGRPGGE